MSVLEEVIMLQKPQTVDFMKDQYFITVVIMSARTRQQTLTLLFDLQFEKIDNFLSKAAAKLYSFTDCCDHRRPP